VESLVGKFNANISNTLILQLNEVEGKTGFENDNKLKTFVMEDYHNVASKGVQAWREQNNTRLFINSNNSNPINITGDNRRFMVIKVGRKRAPAFYTYLYDRIKNRHYLNSIYSYFMDVQLRSEATENLVQLRNSIPETETLGKQRTEYQSTVCIHLGALL
jgi:hypothetical protein